jgi:cation:H+ antiporter
MMSETVVDVLRIVVGLVLLLGGGEFLVRGAVGIAHRIGLSDLVIGLTVVGFGTSMPELLVSLKAALNGQSAIAIGNVVGSNIANILLIVAIAAVIYPMSGWNRAVRRDALIMIAASLVLAALAFSGALPRWAGLVLFALLIGYLAYAYFDDRAATPDADAETAHPQGALARAIGFVVLGLGALFFGADQLVIGATAIARDFGVSEAAIGLTIVAVGTSLPELATSVIAAVRGRSDLALGNVVGSNIFNILGILGLTAMIQPMVIDPQFIQLDIPVMVAVAVAFTALLVFAHKIGRTVGLALLAAYVLYVWTLFAGV